MNTHNYLNDNKNISFIFPLCGDVLNEYDGEIQSDGSLKIKASICCAEGCDVSISGEKACFDGISYNAYVNIPTGKSILKAVNLTSGESTQIDIFRYPDSIGKYRISLDDNILFLKDITDNRDRYKSIFENPYLAVFKKAHDMYGACIHANLFWEFNEASGKVFKNHREYFNLSMMTDKFKDEFIANSSWFKLSFHANSDFPANPYKSADYDTVFKDIAKVNAEIIRFAGKETLSSVTTLHYGAANLSGVKALKDNGCKVLAGFFETTDNGKTSVAYHYPYELVRHIGKRDFWTDTRSNVICARIDSVLNKYKADTVTEALKKISAIPSRFGFLSMLMHEQYFYKDYLYYIPDFEDIILNACKYAAESGHTGSLIGDVVL